ncbi:MAG: efflux RND transporter periplasmic adaptor subunit [Chthoniobacterales bacterium]|nr:efflux RND transporter periplasmic adaptor subunit [Chthoniobacterales bacterium]
MTSSTPSSGKKVTALLLALLTMALFMSAIGFWKKKQIDDSTKTFKNARRPSIAVTSIVVELQVWQSCLEAVGSLSAAQGVMLCADLPGVVYKMPLGPGGTMVKAGTLLVQLDTRQEEAQLRSAEAKLALAKSTLERTANLSQKNVVPKATLDDAKAQYDAALGAVDEIKAIIKRKTLTAPFDGMLGISPLNEGQYLQSGAPIVPLNLLDVLSISFALPQKDFSDLKIGQELRVTAEGVPHHVFKGTITQINSELDTATRNITIGGSIKNEDMLLRGGMFVSIEVVLPEKKNVITIPESAINYALYGDSVFVIQPMKDLNGNSYQGVREQPVTLGATRGDQVEVLAGLKAGEEIVTSGVFKLQPGCPVKVDNSVQPENEAAPKPKDS